jgi:hypothetical protein
MKEKYEICDKSLRARVSQEHLDMLHALKKKYYINISQFMRNAIETEYNRLK